ncbi:ANTAR domain-containing protein [Klenkia brasiliensis]|uniref:ANTAR domain-containing protein n=1 Tax=Klenkia brasiliensis TaxID=333142 RepID=A0A1G7WE85_9ACTN|nr:ANTAR domain-containing protein [Klenkia brasiliensis]SDG70283.1 ANTAR domain-containing protein [Klenkia brasiliensis]
MADTPVGALAPDDVVRTAAGDPAFVVTRTTRGWAVLTPAGSEHAADLVEAMVLADLIAEDLGASPEPGRDVRRAARGSAGDEPSGDPREAELAALHRQVAQLEHALATRVSTERAIGVLAVRGGTTPREAFEQLRREARAVGRPVHDLAREVLDGLGGPPPVPAPAAPPVVERSTRRRVERTRARHAVLVEGER